MPSRPTKGLLAMNADGDRVDDARRRLLADWCRLVGRRVKGDEAVPPDAALSADPVTTTSPPAATTAMPAAVVDLGLPPRMSQVLIGLLAGAAEKQIARELALSPHTIHAYVKQIYKRLAVSSRGELLARFVTLNR